MHEDAHLAGCCGLYCGLCTRYQSTAPSRCLGCQQGGQHDYCSVWRCCVRKRGFTTCAECGEFPCERVMRVIGEGVDSFISHKPALPNLERIRCVGLGAYLAEQRERRLLVEELLASHNDGRSMTFYCTACTLMPVDSLRLAVRAVGTVATDKESGPVDQKGRAKAMRAAIERVAAEAEIDLRLRKKREK